MVTLSTRSRCEYHTEAQFETWWWPSARAGTCCLSNKYSTILLVVFWLYYPVPSYTSDQLVAETSTWQHTTLTTDRHPCPRWDSNSRSQQASGRRPTPQTARPLRSARIIKAYRTKPKITEINRLLSHQEGELRFCSDYHPEMYLPLSVTWHEINTCFCPKRSTLFHITYIVRKVTKQGNGCCLFQALNQYSSRETWGKTRKLLVRCVGTSLGFEKGISTHTQSCGSSLRRP